MTDKTKQADKGNQETIELLDEWFSEPDDMGENFWQEYEEDLKRNPVRIG